MSDDTQTTSSDRSEGSSSSHSSDSPPTQRDGDQSLTSANSGDQPSGSGGASTHQDAVHEDRDRGSASESRPSGPRDNGRDASVGGPAHEGQVVGGGSSEKMTEGGRQSDAVKYSPSAGDLRPVLGGQGSPLRADPSAASDVAQKPHVGNDPESKAARVQDSSVNLVGEVKAAASGATDKLKQAAVGGVEVAAAAANAFASELNTAPGKKSETSKSGNANVSAAENIAVGIARSSADGLRDGLRTAGQIGEAVMGGGALIKAGVDVAAAAAMSRDKAGEAAAGMTNQKLNSVVESLPGGSIAVGMQTFGSELGKGTSVGEAARTGVESGLEQVPFAGVAGEVDQAITSAAKGDTAGAVQHGLNAARQYSQEVVSNAVMFEGVGGPKGPGAPDGPAVTGAKAPEAPRGRRPGPEVLPNPVDVRTEAVPQRGPIYAEVRGGPPVVDGQRPSATGGAATESGLAGRPPQAPDPVMRGEGAPSADAVRVPSRLSADAPTLHAERLPARGSETSGRSASSHDEAPAAGRAEARPSLASDMRGGESGGPEGPTSSPLPDLAAGATPEAGGPATIRDSTSPLADSVAEPRNSSSPTGRPLGTPDGQVGEQRSDGRRGDVGPHGRDRSALGSADGQSTGGPPNSPRELSNAEHTEALREMKELRDARQHYEVRDGKLEYSEHYQALRDKILDHMVAGSERRLAGDWKPGELASEKLSDSDYVRARDRWNEMAASGAAWDGQGRPTPEYQALSDRIQGHVDVVRYERDALEVRGLAQSDQRFGGLDQVVSDHARDWVHHQQIANRTQAAAPGERPEP